MNQLKLRAMRADESYDVDKNASTPSLDSRPSPALSVEEDSEPRSSSALVRLGRQTRSVEVDKTYFRNIRQPASPLFLALSTCNVDISV